MEDLENLDEAEHQPMSPRDRMADIILWKTVQLIDMIPSDVHVHFPSLGKSRNKEPEVSTIPEAALEEIPDEEDRLAAAQALESLESLKTFDSLTDPAKDLIQSMSERGKRFAFVERSPGEAKSSLAAAAELEVGGMGSFSQHPNGAIFHLNQTGQRVADAVESLGDEKM